MSSFDKKEYDYLYTKNNRKIFTLSMQGFENEAFSAYCDEIGVKPAFYIKALVNADMIQRGYDPLFIDGRTKKTVLLSTNDE